MDTQEVVMMHKPKSTKRRPRKEPLTGPKKPKSAMQRSKVAVRDKTPRSPPLTSEVNSMEADEASETSESVTQDLSGQEDISMHTEEEQTDNSMEGRSLKGILFFPFIYTLISYNQKKVDTIIEKNKNKKKKKRKVNQTMYF